MIAQHTSSTKTEKKTKIVRKTKNGLDEKRYAETYEEIVEEKIIISSLSNQPPNQKEKQRIKQGGKKRRNINNKFKKHIQKNKNFWNKNRSFLERIFLLVLQTLLSHYIN